MKELQKEEVKWWYQVIDHGSTGSPDLRVHELYFNTTTKRIVTYTLDPIILQGYESKNEIIADLELMLEDLKKSDNKVLKIKKVNMSHSKIM